MANKHVWFLCLATENRICEEICFFRQDDPNIKCPKKCKYRIKEK